ncbi:MAG: DegT/DnrJ/EryC1/StrS aminotransferase family protein [Desulfobacteraceae bacterium]|nr:DegT/DnrJ/EryC1/StrS aminotransferase family protein [Desulfobacteraceae bacterium]
MIPLAKPDLRQEDIEKAVSVLRSGMLVQGENVSALEESLSQFTGVEYCSLCSSGTAALHLALKGLGIGNGDGVIVPAFTFPASANVVELLGAETILCDVSFDDFIITPESLEECIKASGDNLKAVMVVHEFGCSVKIKEILEICRKHGLLLIEDAACALGAIADGHHVGFYSDAACFSFHPRKAVTCGEGGAVFTHKKDLDNRIRVLRNHGMHYVDGGIDFIEAGFNYRLTDFQAALIHGQLKRFPDELKRRALLAEIYFSFLKECPHLNLPNNTMGHSWQSFMVVLDNNVDRSSIIKQMGQKGVQSNLGAQALNCLQYFSKKYNFKDTDFPEATRLFYSGLVIPLYGSMTENDIKFISSTLKELLKS